MIFNLFGYCLSPLLSGIVMQVYDANSGDSVGKDTALSVGFQLVMGWAFVAMAFTFGAYACAEHQARKDDQADAFSSVLEAERCDYEAARYRAPSCLTPQMLDEIRHSPGKSQGQGSTKPVTTQVT